MVVVAGLGVKKTQANRDAAVRCLPRSLLKRARRDSGAMGSPCIRGAAEAAKIGPLRSALPTACAQSKPFVRADPYGAISETQTRPGDQSMSDHATRMYPPPEAFAKTAHVSGMAAYQKLCAEAEADYAGYWGRLARE